MNTPPLPASHLLDCPTCWPRVAGAVTNDYRVHCQVCGTYLLTVCQQNIPFGKFKGRYVHQMNAPDEKRYLRWFLENINGLHEPLRAALLVQLSLLPLYVPITPMWARTLGITPPATPDMVKQAYREQAKRCHPDKGGSVEEMQQLNEARAQAMLACAA
jgi:hypothetical protein